MRVPSRRLTFLRAGTPEAPLNTFVGRDKGCFLRREERERDSRSAFLDGTRCFRRWRYRPIPGHTNQGECLSIPPHGHDTSARDGRRIVRRSGSERPDKLEFLCGRAADAADYANGRTSAGCGDGAVRDVKGSWQSNIRSESAQWGIPPACQAPTCRGVLR